MLEREPDYCACQVNLSCQPAWMLLSVCLFLCLFLFLSLFFYLPFPLLLVHASCDMLGFIVAWSTRIEGAPRWDEASERHLSGSEQEPVPLPNVISCRVEAPSSFRTSACPPPLDHLSTSFSISGEVKAFWQCSAVYDSRSVSRRISLSRFPRLFWSGFSSELVRIG